MGGTSIKQTQKRATPRGGEGSQRPGHPRASGGEVAAESLGVGGRGAPTPGGPGPAAGAAPLSLQPRPPQ